MKRANNNSMQRFCSRFLAYTAVRPHSHKLYLWNTLLSLASLTRSSPRLFNRLPSARYAGHATVEALLDITFLFGVFIAAHDAHLSRRRRTFGLLFGSCLRGEQRLYRRPHRSFTLEQLASAIGRAANADAQRSTLCAGSSSTRATRPLCDPAYARATRANVVRVVQMLAGFSFAHYLGLFWYARPYGRYRRAPPRSRSIHGSGRTRRSTIALHCMSAFYWALAVMTNLKGNSAHESRQCLYESDVVVAPLESASLYLRLCDRRHVSVIYGSIASL